MNSVSSKHLHNTPESLAIGRVIKTHGLRGEVILTPYRGAENAVLGLDTVRCAASGIESLLYIKSVRPHKGGFICKFDGVDCIETADTLIGCELFVPVSILSSKTVENLFLRQVDGIIVLDVKRKPIGSLKGLLETGGHPVLVIITESEKELLVPAVDEFIVEIDIERKTIVISPPEGIFEINDF